MSKKKRLAEYIVINADDPGAFDFVEAASPEEALTYFVDDLAAPEGEYFVCLVTDLPKFEVTAPAMPTIRSI